MEDHIQTQKQRHGSAVKAVITGLIVDIGGSLVSAFVLVIAYSALLTSRGWSPQEIEHHVTNLEPFSTFSVITMIVGGCMTVVGGYVCARIAIYSEYKITFVFGFISAAFGHIASESYYSTMDSIALGIVTMGCALLGAWLRVIQKANQLNQN
jgi:hypothetical protein